MSIGSFTRVINPAIEASKGSWFKVQLEKLPYVKNVIPESTKQFYTEVATRVGTLKQDVTRFTTQDGGVKTTLNARNQARTTWADGIGNSINQDLTTAGGHDPAHIEQVTTVAKQAASDTMGANQDEAGVKDGIQVALRDWVNKAPINQNDTIVSLKARMRNANANHGVIDNDGFVTNIGNQVREGWRQGESADDIRTRVYDYLDGKGVNGERDDLADLVKAELDAQKDAVQQARQAAVDAIDDGRLDTSIANNFNPLKATYTAHDAALASRGSRTLGQEVTMKSSGKTGQEALYIKMKTADGKTVKAKLPKREHGQSGEDYLKAHEQDIQRLHDLQDRTFINSGRVSKRFFQQGGKQLTDDGMKAHAQALDYVEGHADELFDLEQDAGIKIKVSPRDKSNGRDVLKVTTNRTRLPGWNETRRVELDNTKDTLADSLAQGQKYAEAFGTEQRAKISPRLMVDGGSKLSEGASKRYTDINDAIDAKGTELAALQTHGISMKAKSTKNGPVLRIKQQSMDRGSWFANLLPNKTRHLPLDSKGYTGSVERAVEYADRLTTEAHPDINPRYMRERNTRNTKAVTEKGIERFDQAKTARLKTEIADEITALNGRGIYLRVRGDGRIQITDQRSGPVMSLLHKPFKTNKTSLSMKTGESWEEFWTRAIKEGQGIADGVKKSNPSGFYS